MKYHYSRRGFTYSIELERVLRALLFLVLIRFFGTGDLGGRPSQVGSLAGAAHLLNDNAGVLREAQ